MAESVIIGDAPCPSCQSRGRDSTGNHLILFSNGNKSCNRCGYKEIGRDRGNNNNNMRYTLEDVLEKPIAAIPDRGIDKQVAELYGYRVEYSEETGEIIRHFAPFYKNGHLSGFKIRNVKDKSFHSVGDLKEVDLFGSPLIGDGGQLIIITEGELDAMAAATMFRMRGKNYRVVSLQHGANVSGVQRAFEKLNKFTNIVLCLDQDKPGKEAADKIIPLFEIGKVKVMNFSEKDANDMLMANKVEEFFNSLRQASARRPDGIVSGADTWQRIKDRPSVKSIPYPEEWGILNQKTYGIRRGEVDTWTSGSGMGKTAVLRELQYHLLGKVEESIGVIALEEPLVDSVEALMALHLNKRIQLPDIREQTSDDELYEAWLATSGTNRLHYYDHFGSVDDDSLISKIRWMANQLNCKYIFLDHLSIVVSEFADQGGERERIDTIMTRLKKLTQELDIWLGLVVHLRKVGSGTSFEEGGVPSLDDLRGSGSIKQLSNGVFALSRNQQHPDDQVRNTSTLHVLKCRFTGRTGIGDQLLFSDATGRMEKVEYQTNEDEGEF